MLRLCVNESKLSGMFAPESVVEISTLGCLQYLTGPQGGQLFVHVWNSTFCINCMF